MKAKVIKFPTLGDKFFEAALKKKNKVCPYRVRVVQCPEAFQFEYLGKISRCQTGDLLVLNEHNGILPRFFICKPDELHAIRPKPWL